MQQSLLFLWRFILMLIRIRWSKEAKERFQEFECSSLFAFNSCVYCTTRYNKWGRIGTRWLYFFTYIEEWCIVMEKNIGEKLATRISYQIRYKRCLKGMFCWGVQICQGLYPPAYLDGGGGGSKFAVTPGIQSIWDRARLPRVVSHSQYLNLRNTEGWVLC